LWCDAALLCGDIVCGVDVCGVLLSHDSSSSGALWCDAAHLSGDVVCGIAVRDVVCGIVQFSSAMLFGCDVVCHGVCEAPRQRRRVRRCLPRVRGVVMQFPGAALLCGDVVCGVVVQCDAPSLYRHRK
jgi:hypothetical protein